MKYILKKGLGLFLAVSVILSSFVVMETSEMGIAFAKTKTEKQVAKKVRTAVQKNVYKNVLLADGRTVKEADYDGGCFDVGDRGSITFRSPNKKKGTESFPPAESTTMGEDYFRNQTITYQISDPSVVEIDESMHTYRTVSGGSASVTMSVSYDVPVDPTVTGEAVKLTTKTLTATMLFIVSSDTSQVTLDRYDATIYMTSEYMDGKAEFQMINCPNLKYHNLSVTSSNDKMDISLILDQNKPFFTITCNTAGKTKVTAKLNNTVFTITISVVWLTPSHTSKVLDQGQSFTLKLKNWPESGHRQFVRCGQRKKSRKCHYLYGYPGEPYRVYRVGREKGNLQGGEACHLDRRSLEVFPATADEKGILRLQFAGVEGISNERTVCLRCQVLRAGSGGYRALGRYDEQESGEIPGEKDR